MTSVGRPDGLAASLLELHREMRVILGSVARGAGLTVQQVEMLCLLQRREPSFGELAELLGCDKTNITGMADRLVRRGLVIRQADSEDRRVTRLRLTDDGRAYGLKLRAAVTDAVGERWSAVPAPARDALVGLLVAPGGPLSGGQANRSG
ncbi:DNA-binding transcriptional regulator, MarR family [Parafrankia irregularis]|uniref:DNA-binding transcriptional regulator, MarR family n=1 Tax=Parafrankia irregularis TaxID=795642 RepID=A0A0S4QSP6_9ACTN|nr:MULTISPECIES: MarR family transcriptional regulator [Parafrankia]MBE3205941.1 MarR family transcriptional regulator [Parafrankia sp. CH37]CUU58110.1 DNA-binding transcriptional regulator, MarR family [Parafrankia irregularis]